MQILSDENFLYRYMDGDTLIAEEDDFNKIISHAIKRKENKKAKNPVKTVDQHSLTFLDGSICYRFKYFQ